MGCEDAAGKISGDFETEVKQALDNIGTVLKAAGMSAGDVVSVQVYLTDGATFERMNAVLQGILQRPTSDPDDCCSRQTGGAGPH